MLENLNCKNLVDTSKLKKNPNELQYLTNTNLKVLIFKSNQEHEYLTLSNRTKISEKKNS